jgi:hypothetical protein
LAKIRGVVLGPFYRKTAISIGETKFEKLLSIANRVVYSITWTEPSGKVGRLGQESDFNKRKFFKSQNEAEAKAAFGRSVHPDWEISVQEFEVDDA